MDKENWSCKECGNFRWYALIAPRNEEDKKHNTDWGFDAEDDILINPTNPDQWKKAQLYVGEADETQEVEELSKGDFCEKCNKKISKNNKLWGLD
jgi:hypothetical protein